MKGVCWFKGRPGAGPCDGEMERAHWIKQQVLRRELGVEHVPCPKCGVEAGLPCWDERQGGAMRQTHRERNVAWQELLWDSRVWAWMCHQHHGRLDHARTLRVDRVDLPLGVEEYAAERDALVSGREPLQAWLDMEYGQREELAA